MSDAKIAAGESSYDVLIVDDDESFREALGYVLESEGYSIAMAGSSAEVKSVLAAPARLPRLILLDLVMPDVTGTELYDELRECPRLASSAIVLFSGVPDVAEVAHGLGADGFLAKPSTFEALMGVCEKFAPSAAHAPAG